LCADSEWFTSRYLTTAEEKVIRALFRKGERLTEIVVAC